MNDQIQTFIFKTGFLHFKLKLWTFMLTLKISRSLLQVLRFMWFNSVIKVQFFSKFYNSLKCNAFFTIKEFQPSIYNFLQQQQASSYTRNFSSAIKILYGINKQAKKKFPSTSWPLKKICAILFIIAVQIPRPKLVPTNLCVHGKNII